jgi:phosphoribosylaminoimidazolecarboxamide formyltransferase/IMP cyclohydrolase
MKNALLSVFYKDGIVDFAQELVGLGWNIFASGGTAKALVKAGIEVTDVATFVGGEAILGHKVVTLSREVHAGLLADYDGVDLEEMEKLGLPYIDLACVNLYPLHAEIAKPDATPESVLKNTDIGGPTMLSSAAKGRRIVICDPDDYVRVIKWLKDGKPNEDDVLKDLAAKADFVVAEYRLASARYHSKGFYEGFVGVLAKLCKYGENAWQKFAGLFSTKTDDPLALEKFELVEGTPPSYNNFVDMDRLLQTMTHTVAGFDTETGSGGHVPYIALGAKHGNCCGASAHYLEIEKEPIDGQRRVLTEMLQGDPLAIFGGLVMVNFPIDYQLADILVHGNMEGEARRMLDAVIAPSFTEDAIELLTRKKGKCRLLVNPALATLDRNSLDTATRFRYVRGGFLAQPNYTFVLELNNPGQITRHFDAVMVDQERFDIILAWAIGSTSNSNTITVVKDGMLIGNGTGQQDRVSCAELAVRRSRKVGHPMTGSVAYSDSFFPFPDGPQVLIDNGVKFILASSGSVKDGEVIAACKRAGLNLLTIPDEIGRGFFGH